MAEDDFNTLVEKDRSARVYPVTPIALPTGRFDDEGEMAHGGGSVVHRIFDRTLLRRCAMKVLKPNLLDSAEDWQRFIEEAQITGQLDHPNIVPTHELSITSAGAPYFTMKLVEGQTLEAILAARQGEVRQLDWLAPLLEIFVKVCEAVAFAHSRGVIHRDLKPGNVMVGAYGEVYVMDWGIARLLAGRKDVAVGRDRERQPLDRDGIVLGTPAYMPPEQARGHHQATNERSDIFALGATLYQILTGHPPHGSGSSREQLMEAQAGYIRAPEHYYVASRLPRAFGRITMKAMATQPVMRYASATELKRDLLAQMRGGADLPQRTFAAGELVMKEGDSAEAAYLIVHGTCRAFKTVDGREVELRRMGAGEVFGETAILSNKPRTASVQALEPLTVQVVTPEELQEGVGLNTWVGQFVRTLADRFREVDERLTLLESRLGRNGHQ
jgi:serine/threonine-protein kinase